jgi:hypothetical protein
VKPRNDVLFPFRGMMVYPRWTALRP